MENLNIFDEVKQGQFFKFEKVGDAVQGTYIGKSRAMGKFGEQILYIIQDKAGNVWNVPFGITKTIVHERMKQVALGQIVGFKFDETRPNDKGNDAKIIRVYADAKFIDHEWVKAQRALGVDLSKNVELPPLQSSTNGGEESPAPGGSVFGDQPYVFKAPEEAAPAGGALPKDEIKVSEIDFGGPQKTSGNEAIDAILRLAISKGMIVENAPFDESKAIIEKYAEMPLEDSNLTKIIIKLTGYSK